MKMSLMTPEAKFLYDHDAQKQIICTMALHIIHILLYQVLEIKSANKILLTSSLDFITVLQYSMRVSRDRLAVGS